MQTEYDIAIIGGGIQGCAIAQACAAAGFSTLLLEKNDWGHATSSKSSKLIHGGLRYLQTAQFTLVRESLAEREWMFKHAPDLVKPNWFYVPLYKSSKFRPWQLVSGLTVYQMLSAYGAHSQFKRIPKKQWPNLAGLNQHDLQAVFAYQDGQTDDLLLTQRVQQSAEQLGATCLAGAQLTRAAKFKSGYQVCFKQKDDEHCVKAKMLINAAGPWINHVLACITPAVGLLDIDLVQGSHIVLDQQISEHCFYLESPQDKRVIFIMPWQGKTLVGTTETLFTDHPDHCEVLDEEVHYLMHTVEHYFPDLRYEVVDSFSGLRVLPKASGRAFYRPRDVQITQQGSLISVYGGKLTGWRLTAENVLEAVEGTLGKRKDIDTHDIAF